MDLALDRGPTTSRSLFDRVLDGACRIFHDARKSSHWPGPVTVASSAAHAEAQTIARRFSLIVIPSAALVC